MSRWTATLVGFIAVLMWAVLALLTAASGEVPPFQLAAMTFLIGGMMGVAVMAVPAGCLAKPRPELARLGLGVAGLFGYHFVYFSAIRDAPPVEVSLLAYLWPLFLVVFSALLPGERLRLASYYRRSARSCRRVAGDHRRRRTCRSRSGVALGPFARLCLRHHLGRLFGPVAAICGRPDRHRRRFLPCDRGARGAVPSDI